VGNAILLVSVWWLLHGGYHGGPRHTPLLFLYFELLIIFVLFVAALTDEISIAANGFLNIFRRPRKPPRTFPGWTKQRVEERVVALRGLMYIAVTLNFFALWNLVDDTGGGIESAFAPLLLAPAILGIVIVSRKTGLVMLFVGALISAFATDYVAHNRVRLVVVHQVGRPKWWVYAVVPLILVFCAAAMRYLGLPSTIRPPGKQTLFRRGFRRVFRRGVKEAEARSGGTGPNGNTVLEGAE
jgi:hypothetical protein